MKEYNEKNITEPQLKKMERSLADLDKLITRLAKSSFRHVGPCGTLQNEYHNLLNIRNNLSVFVDKAYDNIASDCE